MANFDTTGISSATSGEWSKKHEEENERLKNELFSARMRESIENGEKDELTVKLSRHSCVKKITEFMLRIVARNKKL